MIYLDTSALLKLVFEEGESQALAEWSAQRTEIPKISSDIAGVELRRNCRRINDVSMWVAERLLLGIHLLPVDTGQLAHAGALDPIGLRTLDALHLAGALSVRSELTAFVSYDHQLIDAAASAGLPVVTPA